MSTHPAPSRRAVLQAGGVGVLAAVATAAAARPAGALGPSAARPSDPKIDDLGPAVTQFALMSARLVGDSVYIGTRNVEPARVVAFHVPTRTVTVTTSVPTGYAIQAMAADPTGRYLYFGMLKKTDGPEANLYRWDLTTPDAPAEELGRLGDRDVRAVAVAPDGVVFAVGGGSPTVPELWQYDPATGEVTSLGVPDPAATLARAVAATGTTVYVGAGTTFGGGTGTSRASLVAYDRASGTFTQVVPDELAADSSIRDLAVVGDRLVASTAGSTDGSTLALIDLDDPASYTTTASIGTTAKNFAADGDDLYFANDTGIVVLRADGTIEQLALGTLELGEIWGVDAAEGRLQVVSAYGFVAEIDVASHGWTTTDLAEAGAPVSAQTCMGIAAGGGYVYVGGNGVIARHSVATGEVVNLRAPGEAKDADVVDGVLYTGQYNSQGIWSYDPRGDDRPQQVADFSSAQNRPLDTAWDDANQLLLVGVQSDTEGGGSIWTYDPRSGGSSIVTNPIDDIQLVRAVATADGVAYLGGDNAQKAGPRGTVVAWDPVEGTELWRVETGQPKGIAALAVQGRHLYALTIGGTLVVVDRVRRRVVHTASHKALVPGFAAMVTNRGVVYAVSDTTLLRFDPGSFAPTVVIAETAGGWYSGAHLNVDEEGRIYTLRGRNLVRVDDHPRR
ncbi:PQQ-binding-like beta-propeller repeat protein [Isoptericola sp. F-RaC21]|uniref:outer membrane protein assembly factor BamB family protein n=1 Tax=Isoptericola sp. F-RaC21 TaxID=3141452 RepID=UPI00315B5837